MWSIEKIKKDLKENLSEYRYLHSLRTMEEAVHLAEHYGYDVKEAALSALAHDRAKELSDMQEKQIIHKYHLETLKGECPRIKHAYLGAVLAKEKYGFTDVMADAIASHSTGKKNMNVLEKIVFLADKIEPGKNYPGIEEERKLAYIDLDRALICCLENQILKLEQEHKRINEASIEALNDLKENE